MPTQAAYVVGIIQGFRVCIPMWHTVSMDSTQQERIDELQRIADAYHRAQKRADERRAVLHETIRAAAAAGVRQVDIVSATGYTRDNIRKTINPELRKPKAKRTQTS